MPRTRRWAQVKQGFNAGILSPASQDLVDAQAWLSGAARLENFTVERDGGIKGRPAFLRSSLTVPKPVYGLLAGRTWSSFPGTGGTSTVRGVSTPTGVATGTFPADLYRDTSRGGRAPLQLETYTVDADPDLALLQVNLASGAPRAITFHGVWIESGSWSRIASGQRRLNLRMLGHVRGTAADALIEYAPDVASDADEDPFLDGQFAPGEIARDIVFRLDLPGKSPAATLDWVRLAFTDADAATPAVPFILHVDEVSCFSYEPAPEGATPSVLLPDDTFDAPWRILPWTIRDDTFALVLGMDYVSLVRILPREGRTTRLFVQQGDREAVFGSIWHFTERQLRELTWATYGGNLLLCHHDFPHPLEVRLPEGAFTSLNIRPLRLVNVPELSASDLERVIPTFGDEAGPPTRVAPSPTRLPQQPLPARLTAGTEQLTVRWSGTGADTYRVYWDTKAVYDTETAGGGTWTPSNMMDVGPTVRQHVITGLTAVTEYAVAVASRVGTSESAYSTPVFAFAQGAQLAKPVVALADGANTGTGRTDGKVNLSWTAIPNATGYALEERRAERVDVPPGATDAAIGTDIPFSGTPGVTHYFRIQARNATETPAMSGTFVELYPASEWSDVVSIQAMYQAPAQPTNLVATNLGAHTVRLDWDAVPDAEAYEVRQQDTRDPGKWSDPMVLQRGGSIDVGAFGLQQTFTFEVRATRTFAPAGEWSDDATIRVLGGPASTPTLDVTPVTGIPERAAVRLTSNLSAPIRLQWRRSGTDTDWPANDAAQGLANRTWILVTDNVRGEAYREFQFASGDVVEFRARQEDHRTPPSVVPSAWTAVVEFGARPLLPPVGAVAPRVSLEGRRGIVVGWNVPARATSVEVQVLLPGVSDPVLMRTVDAATNTWTFPDGEPIAFDTTYEVRVRGRNDEGIGAWSPRASITTQVPPIMLTPVQNLLVQATPIGGTTHTGYQARWASVPQATSYDYAWGDPATRRWSDHRATTPEEFAAQTVTTNLVRSPIWFRVRARNPDATIPAWTSTVASFTTPGIATVPTGTSGEGGGQAPAGTPEPDAPTTEPSAPAITGGIFGAFGGSRTDPLSAVDQGLRDALNEQARRDRDEDDDGGNGGNGGNGGGPGADPDAPEGPK